MLEQFDEELKKEEMNNKVWRFGTSMANGKKITEEELYYFLRNNGKELFEGFGRFRLGIRRLWRNVKEECKSDRVKETILEYFGVEKKIEDVKLEDIFVAIDEHGGDESWFLADLFGQYCNESEWQDVIDQYPNLWFLIPERYFKLEELKKRILENPEIFEYYPHKLKNYEEIKEILIERGDFIESQKEMKRKESENINESYESALKHVRETGELYGIEEKYKTVELCMEAIKRGWGDYSVPKEVIENDAVLELYRKNGYIYVLKEGYDDRIKKYRAFILISNKEFYHFKKLRRDINDYDGSFGTIKRVFKLKNEKHFVDYRTNVFDKYLKVLGGKIVGDYTNCGFKNVKLNNCDISEAIIRKEVLDKQDFKVDKLYLSLKEKNKELKLAETTTEVRVHSEKNRIKHTDQKIYYVSDIHLDHKILNEFKNSESDGVVKNYITEIVRNISKDVEDGKIVIVLGDVSSSYEIIEYFYKKLKEELEYSKIIAILGNHEYRIGNNYGEVLESYRLLFNNLGIQLLQNDLLLKKRGCYQVLDESVLEKTSVEELTNYCKDAELLMYGGTGFAAYSKEYTALDGLYLDCINAEEELALTQKFDEIYRKICLVASKRKLIVATHNPKTDYSLQEYCQNIIYLSGHTHINVYDPKLNLYADNQIGYIGRKASFKYFYYSEEYDVFDDYDDGVYEISSNQYLDFNRGKGIGVTYSKKEGTIIMLKRSGIYMFLLKTSKKLYLLSGGVIRKLENQDIDYYYKNMIKYFEIIEKNLNAYNRALETISNQIRAFGGSGIIHGCIIDIDYWNHIYLNPIDGKVTPYSATTMTDKRIYSSVKTLLKNNNPQLYEKYISYTDDSKKNEIAKKFNDLDSVKDESTLMYKPSRIFKEIQYLTEDNIIRKWIDNLVDDEIMSLPE